LKTKIDCSGNLQIFLTSPMGTNSTLLGRRVEDDSVDGFNNWPFMTVHNWGESPRGIWTLEIVDVENNGLYTIED
jgi:subtilisin-like proprotein convertase family protein